MSQQRIPPEVQQLLTQYQMLRDNYVKIDAELKLVDAELAEIEQVLDTLNSIEGEAEVYKAIGRVMVKKGKEDVIKELEERKEFLGIKKEKYKNQLAVLQKQINDLERKLKETLAKYGMRIG